MIRTLPAFPALIFFNLISHGQNAHSLRPNITTDQAIHQIRLSFPIPIKAFLEKPETALSEKAEPVRAEAYAAAQAYLDFIHRRTSQNEWKDLCKKADSQATLSKFCEAEENRAKQSHSTTRPSNTPTRLQVRRLIVGEQYTLLENAVYRDIVLAISHIGNQSKILSAARNLNKKKSCVPQGIFSAIAYKIEEYFPEENVVQLAESLYSRAIECSDIKTEVTVKASFRRALLHIWKHEYSQALPLMKTVRDNDERGLYTSRSLYWIWYLAQKTNQSYLINQSAKTIAKNHPLSFYNIAVNGMQVYESVRNNDRRIGVSKRPLLQRSAYPLLRAIDVLYEKKDTNALNRFVTDQLANIRSLDASVQFYIASLLFSLEDGLSVFRILSPLMSNHSEYLHKDALHLFFPNWYFDLVKELSQPVDPFLILGLIRQESAFNPRAHSPAGARGLMQLLPSTARNIRRGVTINQLYQPRTSIDLGSRYFQRRLRQFQSDTSNYG